MARKRVENQRHKRLVQYNTSGNALPTIISTNKDFHDIGGYNVLQQKYNASISQLLYQLYPDFEWLPWKLANCPKNYWDDMKNQRKFMDWAGKELKIKEMSDWYNVTQKVEVTSVVGLIN
jgi:hypothetical protein